jgi:hypothetical protein
VAAAIQQGRPVAEISNPLSGERITISGTEADGSVLTWELSLAPGGQVPASHTHPRHEERFTVLAGQVHRPQTTDHRPQTTDHRPQTTDHRPQTTDHRPQTTDHRPQTKRAPASPAHVTRRWAALANEEMPVG